MFVCFGLFVSFLAWKAEKLLINKQFSTIISLFMVPAWLPSCLKRTVVPMSCGLLNSKTEYVMSCNNKVQCTFHGTDGIEAEMCLYIVLCFSYYAYSVTL